MRALLAASVIVLAFAGASGCSSGGRKPETRTAVLTWTPCVEDTDGNALTDLTGYRLIVKNYSGSSAYSPVSIPLPPSQTTYRMPYNALQRYSVVCESGGLGESDPSNEVSVVVN